MIDKLLRFGCPYHGMIMGGEIHLPNGEKVPAPQPGGLIVTYSGSTTVLELSGSTLLQRMPWAPGGTDTEEDVLAGRHWADYAILGGNDQRLHGKRLQHSWIYAAPDGNPWRINAANLYSITVGTPLSAEISVNAFGRVGAPSVTHRYTVNLPSTGQTMAGLGSWRYAFLHDITPDGSKAIFALYYQNTSGDTARFGALHPIGFLQLSLSGTPGIDFEATLSVLKTDVQTLGALTHTPAVEEEREYVPYNLERVDGEYRWSSIVQTLAMAAYGPEERGISGRVVAMWYDEAGEVYPVTMTVTDARAVEWSFSAVATGGPLTGDPGGAGWSGPDMEKTTEERSSRDVSATIGLHYKGFAISATISSNAYRLDTTHTVLGPSHGNNYGIVTSTREGEAVITTPVGTETIEGDFPPAPMRQGPFTELQAATAMSTGRRITSGGVTHGLGVIRHANNCLSLAYARMVGSNIEWAVLDTLTPAGVTQRAAMLGPPKRFASWNPATNEIAGPADQAVCFT